MKPTDAKTVLMLSDERRDGYYHIYAAFVFEKTENGHTVYRNPSDTQFNDVVISCQGNDEEGTLSDTCPLYAWNVRLAYGNKDVGELEPIVRLLQTIRKGLQKIQETDGYAATFGEYVLRVAKMAKVSHAVVANGKSGGWSYDDNEYRTLSLGDMRNYINSMERTWIASLRERYQKAA